MHGVGHLLGERHFRSKLTDDDVRRIREMAPGHTLSEIGRRFGIDKSTAGKIINRKAWQHVV